MSDYDDDSISAQEAAAAARLAGLLDNRDPALEHLESESTPDTPAETELAEVAALLRVSMSELSAPRSDALRAELLQHAARRASEQSATQQKRVGRPAWTRWLALLVPAAGAALFFIYVPAQPERSSPLQHSSSQEQNSSQQPSAAPAAQADAADAARVPQKAAADAELAEVAGISTRALQLQVVKIQAEAVSARTRGELHQSVDARLQSARSQLRARLLEEIEP